MDLTGKRVLVTGGASGLGLAIAQALHASGAIPLVVDRDEAALQRVSVDLKCPVFKAELTDPEDVDRMIAAVCADGVPQGLVNNAGIIRNAPLLNMFDRVDSRHSLALWNEVLDVNLTAVFLVTRSLVARMVEQRVRGAVVSMSSISARGNAGQGAYSAAKAGVEALTKTWAKELGPLGIRFLAIAPGFVDTPSTRAALNDDALTEIKRRTPLRRLGLATEIAAAVLYALQNDMATGTVIEVDGGLCL